MPRHAFWRWLDRAAGRKPAKRDIILAALFMVLANRYDWQLFLEVMALAEVAKVSLLKLQRCLQERITPPQRQLKLWSPRENVRL